MDANAFKALSHLRSASVESVPNQVQSKKVVNGIKTLLASENEEARNSMITEAFVKTNDEIKNRSFNVSFSGTTAVTVMLCGNRLICSNVGDSRAVMASFKNPKEIKNVKLPEEFLASLKENEKIWLALPLSRDHKPDDEDEHKRIIENNGRVEPFREPNGDFIGPPRVWLAKENIPGLAMSRSLGDKTAARAGVICLPEISDMQLTEEDKFIVIGSDGVWEFLPNDEIVELVVPYWQNKDPEGACNKIISESVIHWQNEDDVIDDITVIVIFLSLP